MKKNINKFTNFYLDENYFYGEILKDNDIAQSDILSINKGISLRIESYSLENKPKISMQMLVSHSRSFSGEKIEEKCKYQKSKYFTPKGTKVITIKENLIN